MSNYYRPPQKQAYNWREREAESARKAAEEEQRKKNVMNENNFPTLTTVRPQGTVKGNQYAQLAQKWAIDAEVDKRMEDYKKFREASDRIAVMHSHSRESRYERHEEYYEEDMEDQPKPARSFLDDDAGWSEVRGKSYKPPREKSVEEMDRMVQERQEQEDMEFNGELFDSNRHDHHKV